MLWYKVWRESRVRFLITAFTLIAFCVFTVLFEPFIQANAGLLIPFHLRKAAHSEYIYNLIYSGQAKGLFALLVIFLGLGGVQRERSHNTAVFTLALPVSRLRLIGAQIAVGAVQLAILALLPAVFVPTLCTVAHQSFPLSEALHFSALWFACGLVIYSSSFFLAVVTPGEYTAPIACYLLLMIHTVAAQWHPLRQYRLNLMWRMGEFRTMQWDQSHTFLLPPPLSWTALFVMALISTVLFATAARVTDRQDF
jgi:ABC-type transport system involved in multi-copper enzyme maturation permease subunit